MAHFPKPFFRKPRKRWYVQLDGKQINLGPDKEAAFDRYHELMRERKHGTAPAATAESFAAIADHFLEWVKNNRSPDTYEWYRYRIQRFVDRYPDLLAAQIKPHHVETWADSYRLSVTSKRNYLRSVKRCMKWAKRQGYIDDNPIADLEVPAGEAKEVYVSPEDFAQLLAECRHPAARDLLEVTYLTGCRPQESLRVEARHVDVANQRWVFPASESKGKRVSRIVYANDEAMLITRRLMLANPTGPIFRNLQGRPWTTDAINNVFTTLQIRMGKARMDALGMTVSEADVEALLPSLNPSKRVRGKTVEKKKAELWAEARRKLASKIARSLVPRYSLYALRHSWATNALKRGLDGLTVAILMGHQDPSTLSKVYQHLSLSPDHMLDAAKKAAG